MLKPFNEVIVHGQAFHGYYESRTGELFVYRGQDPGEGRRRYPLAAFVGSYLGASSAIVGMTNDAQAAQANQKELAHAG